MQRLRLILWAMVLVTGAAATIFYLIGLTQQTATGFGGEFTLQSTAGGSFTERDLAGVPSLVFFGYTFCPDVCPTTLAETTGWRAELGLDESDLRIIFVSVDPERDTLENMKEYVSIFGSPVIGLTGTLEQVEAAKAAFGVFSEKVEDPGVADYLVNHTASVLMIDGDGNFLGTIVYEENRETALAKIRRLLAA
ncbi:MAG TPA: SCO family protein [Devosia sp.]|nr:SCO family protein [Devosia sp.]